MKDDCPCGYPGANPCWRIGGEAACATIADPPDLQSWLMKHYFEAQKELHQFQDIAFPYYAGPEWGATHPQHLDYLATNLADLLRAHPESNNGDWYHTILGWCDRHMTGNIKPNCPAM